MPSRSSALFSTGVPVRPNCACGEIERTTWLVVPARFLIRCDSSSTTRSNAWPASSVAVAEQQLVVGDPHRHVGQRHCQLPLGLVAFDHHRGTSGAQWANSRCQLVTSGLGQTSSTLRTSPRCEQQADGRDGLHRLAQPHLVGQDRRLTRIEEGNALELERKRRQGNASEPSASSDSSDGCNR